MNNSSSFNRYNNQNDFNNNQDNNNKLFFNKFLKSISSWGMYYNDMVFKNSYSLGIYEDPISQNSSVDMYELVTKKQISKFLENKNIAYLDLSYPEKRNILRTYAVKHEISNFVSRVTNEAIIYDDSNFFCYADDLPLDINEDVRQKWIENFKRLYISFGFNDGIIAWEYFKQFLIDGYLAFEIIYDDKLRNVIGLQQIDPLTLTIVTDPVNNMIVWVQYPNDPVNRRVLLDSQIIYISYSNNSISETSYIEPLIRPFNQLRLLELTRLLFNINHSAIYRNIIVPVNGLTKAKARTQLYDLMSEYHEEIDWDEHLGIISINGSSKLKHSKDIWLPSSEFGTPSVDIVTPQGINLNEDVVLLWFHRKLKQASMLPFNRFDDDNGGGIISGVENYELTHQEDMFQKFLKRIRTIFKEIILKPLKIQMYLDFPELKNDVQFNSSIKIKYNTNVQHEEMRYLLGLEKRAQIASTLMSNLQDGEGKSYLSIEWIMKNVIKFTDEQIKENERYKLKNENASTSSENTEGAGGESTSGGGMFGGNEGNTGETGGEAGSEFGGETGGEAGGEAGGGSETTSEETT